MLSSLAWVAVCCDKMASAATATAEVDAYKTAMWIVQWIREKTYCWRYQAAAKPSNPNWSATELYVRLKYDENHVEKATFIITMLQKKKKQNQKKFFFLRSKLFLSVLFFFAVVIIVTECLSIILLSYTVHGIGYKSCLLVCAHVFVSAISNATLVNPCSFLLNNVNLITICHSKYL